MFKINFANTQKRIESVPIVIIHDWHISISDTASVALININVFDEQSEIDNISGKQLTPER